MLAASILSPAVAGTVAVPNTFQPNTPALASEVNANFQTLVDALNAQQTATEQLQNELTSANSTINQLQSDLAATQSDLAATQSDLTATQSNLATTQFDLAVTTSFLTAAQNELDLAEANISSIQSNSVLALDGLLFLDMDAEGNDVARFDQINVQITNGLGATNGDPMSFPDDAGPTNGLGNLVIGYNETIRFGLLACSNGQFSDQTACEGANETWAAEQRTGSHNLVLGVGQFYTSHGGLLAGSFNVVNRRWSSVSGGQNNTASGPFSSVSGGESNTASGQDSSVSGGQDNTASGVVSSVNGGFGNTASAVWSSVSGGTFGTKTANGGWCAGGQSGTTPCN